MSGIFSIDGNIGSGKSTAVGLLKGKFGDNVIFVDEPVDIWNSIKNKEGETILKKFYERPHIWAFSFQMMAYISRLSILKKYIKQFPTAILITERSTFTDYNVFAKMLYDNGDINEIEYQIYMKWFHEFIADIPIKGFIYITTEPKKCLERIHKRNRKGDDVLFEEEDILLRPPEAEQQQKQKHRARNVLLGEEHGEEEVGALVLGVNVPNKKRVHKGKKKQHIRCHCNKRQRRERS